MILQMFVVTHARCRLGQTQIQSLHVVVGQGNVAHVAGLGTKLDDIRGIDFIASLGRCPKTVTVADCLYIYEL